jgi:hypothetical protein
MLGVALVLACALAIQVGRKSREAEREAAAAPRTLTALLRMPPEALGAVPTARMNLLCGSGLSSGDEPDVEGCLAALKVWAERVRSETARHSYRFRQDPGEYENSEGFFRMLMMTVVLEEDFKVHYDTRRRARPGAARLDDGFFADPKAVFLHGLLGPERQGTCSSMPVLYVAVGRELGYPLKLVTTKGHLFVRWDDEVQSPKSKVQSPGTEVRSPKADGGTNSKAEAGGERFNVEATGHGLNRFSDDYYRHWPYEVSAEEEAAEGYLKSLAPAEELAVFLSIRGLCLREAGRLAEAAESFAAAARLAPGCAGYRTMADGAKTGVNR